MSRILEFQPTDEQTVVARVLVELHQAIDTNFPNANPSNRQFSKTVLTRPSEATQIDNTPANESKERRSRQHADEHLSFAASADTADLSLTPKTGSRSKRGDSPLLTADLKQLMGESPASRVISKVLIGLLILGVAVLTWFIFVGTEGFPELLP